MNDLRTRATNLRTMRDVMHRHCFDFGLYTFTMDTESIQMAEIEAAFRSLLKCYGRRAPQTSLTKAFESVVDLKMLQLSAT